MVFGLWSGRGVSLCSFVLWCVFFVGCWRKWTLIATKRETSLKKLWVGWTNGRAPGTYGLGSRFPRWITERLDYLYELLHRVPLAAWWTSITVILFSALNSPRLTFVLGGSVDGSKPGALGITPDQMTDEIWNTSSVTVLSPLPSWTVKGRRSQARV